MDPKMLDEVRDIPAADLCPYPIEERRFLVDRMFARPASQPTPSATSPVAEGDIPVSADAWRRR